MWEGLCAAVLGGKLSGKLLFNGTNIKLSPLPFCKKKLRKRKATPKEGWKKDLFKFNSFF